MKKILIIVLAFAFCFGLVACNQVSNGDDGTEPNNPTDNNGLLEEVTELPEYTDNGERMLISFMNEARPDGKDLEKSFEVLQESGITTYAPWGYDYGKESILERYDLMYLPHTEEKTPQEVSQYLMPDNISDNVIGYYYKDEPTYTQITGYAEDAKNHQENYADKLFLVNLLPDWESDRGEGGRFGGEYIDYVAHYCDVVFGEITENRLLSVDCYPLNSDGTIKSEWLTCYETIAEFAKEYGADFHFYVANTQHWGYRKLDLDNLRYMVNVAMTYGGNGLSYFTYVTYEDKLAEGWGDGLVKVDGITPSETYAIAQQVNSELLSWDHVFLNFKWEDTMTLEGTNGGENYLYSDLQFNTDKIDIIEKIVSSEDTLIGRFTGTNDEIGLMVTNFSDPKDKKTDTVELTLKEANKAIVYVNGTPVIRNVQDGKLTLSLPAGTAAFVIPVKFIGEQDTNTPYQVKVLVESESGTYEDKTADYTSILGSLTGMADADVDLTEKAEAIAEALGADYYFDETHEGCVYTGTILPDGSAEFTLYFSRSEMPVTENVLISYTGEITTGGWTGESTNSTFTTETLRNFAGVPAAEEIKGKTSSVLKVDITSGNNRVMFEYVPEKTDWSAYDYVGFWVYNDTDKSLFARHGMHRVHADEPDGSTGVNGSPAGNVGKGCWSFVTIDMRAFKVGGIKEVYNQNNVQKFSFEFERNNNEWGEIADGSTLYLTDVRGYTYEDEQDTDETLVVRLDGAVGPNNLAYWTESAQAVWQSKYEEVTVGGSAYRMTKVEYWKETATTGNKPDAENAVLFGGRLNTAEMAEKYSAYTFKVYNPNDFDIVINGKTVRANSIADITIEIVVGQNNGSADNNVNWFTSYRMMINPKRTDGKPIAAQGVSLYLGNVYGVTWPDSYTINFNSDGGSKIDSVTVKRGESFTAPTAPTKTGYTFAGWQLNGVDYNFDTPVTADITLTAKWMPNDDTIYTVEVYLESESDDGTYIKSEEYSKQFKGTTDAQIDLNTNGFIESLNVDGYYYDSTHSQNRTSGSILADGSLVLKVYYSKEDAVMYTVTFTVDGESYQSFSVAENTAVSKPTEPSKQGYVFAGWQLNGADYDFDTPVTEDITLTAKWTPATDTEYTVLVFAWDGSAYTDRTDEAEIKEFLSDLTATTGETVNFAEEEGKYKSIVDEIIGILGIDLYELNVAKGQIQGKIACDGSTTFELYFSAIEGNENLLVASDTDVIRYTGNANNSEFSTESISVADIDDVAKQGFESLLLTDTHILKLTITKSQLRIQFNTIPQLTNWSGYDYVGFWVYNGSDNERYARHSHMITGDPYVQSSIRLRPHAWSFVAFDLHKYQVGGFDKYYALNDVQEYSIEIECNSNSTASALGKVFYITNVRGYLYANGESSENIVERMDEAVGVGAIADATEALSYAFNVSTGSVQTDDGARSMTKVEYVLETTEFKRNLIFPGVLNTDSRYSAYQFDVYNANDYAITIVGQKIEPNSFGTVTVQCVKTEQGGDNANAGWGSYYRMRWFPQNESGATPVGLTIYIGNIYGIPTK